MRIERAFPVVVFLCALTYSSLAQDAKPTPQPEDDVVKISTNLIQIDVTVTDKRGNAVTDLKPEDFEVYENGEKQNLTNFSFIAGARAATDTVKKDTVGIADPVRPPNARAGQVRRTIALVVDDLSLSYESANLVRRTLKKYVDAQMQDGDLVTIIRTGAGSGVLQQFTSDKRLLYASIENVRFNPLGRGQISAFEQITDIPESLKDQTKSEASKVADAQFRDSYKDFQESVFGTGTLAALRYVIDAMRGMPGRKSVVLFSDGIQILQRDEHGYTEGGKVSEFLRIVTEYANRSSVVFYTFDARTLQNPDTSAADSISLPPQVSARLNGRQGAVIAERTRELSDTQGGLDYLAKETGGFAIRNQNDLNAGLQKVLEDQSYYLLGYAPDTDTFDAKVRRYNKLEIKVKRDGLDVRYRSGFFNVTDEPVKPKDQAAAKNRPLENIITSPFAATSISLRLNTVFGNGPDGSYVTPLLNVNANDLKFTDGPDGTKRVVIDVLAMSFGADGVPVDKLSKTITFDIEPVAYAQVLKSGFLCHFNFPIKNPGGYQFRVAVRDKQAETVGTASQFIEIPDLKKNKLTMSGILLENFTSEQWSKFSGDIRKVSDAKGSALNDQTDPMNDTSLRRFRQDSVLRYGFEVYNFGSERAKKVPLYTRIRVFREGQKVLDGPELPLEAIAQGDLKRIRTGGAMNLPREMPIGAYILQIIVTEGSGTDVRQAASQFVEFEIVQQ